MYIEIIDKIKRIANRYAYVSCLIPAGIFAVVNHFLRLTQSLLQNPEKFQLLAEISGNLIGFILLLMIFFAISSKQTPYFQRFCKYGHNKIFAISCILSAIFLFFCIITWTFSFMPGIVFYTFVFGISELAVVLYYLFWMVVCTV